MKVSQGEGVIKVMEDPQKNIPNLWLIHVDSMCSMIWNTLAIIVDLIVQYKAEFDLFHTQGGSWEFWTLASGDHHLWTSSNDNNEGIRW
jgi:hypothetical protein